MCRGYPILQTTPTSTAQQESDAMGKIIFITHDGQSHEADIIDGCSLMQIATGSLVPGIDGDCGGSCACGTCHVILDSEWHRATGAIKADEEQMLALNPERQPTSRLACQVPVTAQMDGMTVRLPEFQM